jgi:hypothetical protein
VHRSTLALWKQQSDFTGLVSEHRARLKGQCSDNSLRSRRSVRLEKTRIRGLKLQMAILLIAEANLTDREIAKQLKVSFRALEEANERPYFGKRVEETRSILAQLRARVGDGEFREDPGISMKGT